MAASGGVSMDTLLQSLEDYQRHSDQRIEELVEVPNTEFVALIVGRNGHKIKAIREKTDTFIKTPMRNESPVFKIAGTLQNVARAKHEITDIVQRLKSPHYRMGALGDESQGPRITSSVRVPFKFVGLVVGFQGSTIMEIQGKTKTHIQTPAHGGEPIFQITGEPKNVWIAKIMIQFYIEYRTGLRVLEVDSLVDGSIEEPILQMLAKHGVSHTLTVLMSRLDDILVDDQATPPLMSPDSLGSPTSTKFLDPIDAMGFKLDSFSMDDDQQITLDPHQFMGGPLPAQFIPLHMNSPPAQNMASSPQPQPNCAEFFKAPNQSQAIYQQLHATPINALFPEGQDAVVPPQFGLTGNFWLGPMIQPPLQQHQPQPQPLHNQSSPVGDDLNVPSAFLDKTFWDYVANAENELPPEQVL